MRVFVWLFFILFFVESYANHCEEIDSIFLNVTSETGHVPACRCYLNQHSSLLEAIKEVRLGDESFIWIGCSGQNMPSVFRALNSLNETFVSRLFIWDSLINILPTDMFSKVFPRSLIVESSSVSVFRKGAFSKIGNYLKELKLSKNIVKSIDATMFEGISELTSLDVSDNKISTLSAHCFDTLSKLESLSLSGNHLAEIPDSTFKGLTSLKSLDLSNNKLKHIGRDSFHGLQKLEVLTLHSNNLDDIHPLAFEELINLKVLDLGNNTLAKIEIKNMPKLRRFLLNNNSIESLEDVFMKDLPSLEIVSFDHNSIKSIGKDDFQGLISSNRLSSLSLARNHITLVNGDAFASLDSLNTLSLQNNQLTNLTDPTTPGQPPYLRPLSSLRNLFLSHNQLQQVNKELHGLIGLKVLALDHNQIYKIEPEAFKDLPIQKLFLESNKLYYLPEKIFDSFNKEKLQAIDVSNNSWICIWDREWLGNWLQSIGDANLGDLACLSRQNKEEKEDYVGGDGETESSSWMIYLASLLSVVTIISLAAIGYLLVQENRRNRLLFNKLRRVPSDMVRLIPENLSFPTQWSLYSATIAPSLEALHRRQL
uniref:Uncharacterized protein n=1 Tax=Ditylenchus dipsaci TaxID=166011 RepID=A0A915D221_9BILA